MPAFTSMAFYINDVGAKSMGTWITSFMASLLALVFELGRNEL